MGINKATPEDWERLRRDFPAVDPYVDKYDMQPPVDSMVNSPKHYTAGDVECIDGIEASMTPEAFKGYCKGSSMKYLWRYELKAKPLEDLHKAQWYLNKLISKVEE
jgi:hypothetical protein